MADYASNFTFRYRTDYRSRGDRHSFTLRFSRGTTVGVIASITSMITGFLGIMAPMLDQSWAVLGAAYALTDSDIFLPTTPPTSPDVSTNGTTVTDELRAFQARFEGRGVNGPRANFSIYGFSDDIEAGPAVKFRLLPADSTAISDTIDALRFLDPPPVAIDGSTVVWYPYINVKDNDHYVHKLRAA